MVCFLYDKDLRQERVKIVMKELIIIYQKYSLHNYISNNVFLVLQNKK